MTQPIPLAKPYIGKEEEAEVLDTMRSGLIGTGVKTEQLEKEFAAYLGSKHAIGTNSCTGSLHLSLHAIGVGPGDEVITTAMTFVSTASSMCFRPTSEPECVASPPAAGFIGFSINQSPLRSLSPSTPQRGTPTGAPPPAPPTPSNTDSKPESDWRPSAPLLDNRCRPRPVPRSIRPMLDRSPIAMNTRDPG